MTQVSRAAWNSSLTTKVNDNTSGDVTPQDIREVLVDLEDSAIWYDEGPLAATFNGYTTATPVLADVVTFVDDPAGTPLNRKTTWQGVMDLFEANFAAPASAISSGTFADARISESSVTQHQAALSVTESQISDLQSYLLPADIGSTVQGYDADTLKADTSDNLTAGYTATIHDLGTIASGTVTPDPANGNYQKLTNNGAFTLAAPSLTAGQGTSIRIDVTNGASAGTITFSGFAVQDGDTLTTTNGHEFFIAIEAGDVGATATVKALQ